MNSRNNTTRRTRWWVPAALLLGGLFQANTSQATTCAGATNIATPTVTNQSIVCGATNDLSSTTVPATCGGASNSYKGGNEALYTYTASVTGNHIISIAGVSYTSIFVYNGCPTSGGTCVGSVGNSSTSKSLTASMTSGQTYYIWFDTWPTPNSPCPGTFSISQPVAPLPGDNCSNALDLATLTSPLSSTTNTPGVNADFSIACGTASTNTAPDRIYYIDVPAGYVLTIGQTTNGYDSQHYLRYGGSCPGSNVIICYDDDFSEVGTEVWTNTTGVTQRVWWIQDGYGSASGTFTLAWSLALPPACTTPTSTAATSITANSALANWTCAGCTGTGGYIVEYGPAATFTTPGTGATAGPNGTVIPGATAPQLLSGLASSTQYRYFVRQDCDGGNTTFSPNSLGQTFTTLAAPPPNDACSNAITIACASTPVTGSTNLSNVDAEYSDCGAAGNNTTERGVWYKIVGDDNQYTITTCDPSGTGYDTRLTVYSGSCGAFTCVTANDDMSPACATGSFRSRVQFNANSGTDYYVFVHGYQSGTGLSAQGNFILNITCSPLCLPVPGNDVCASATALTVDAPALAGTNTCAAATVGNPTCESAFATLPDVFYSFTASPGGTNLVTFNLYTATNLGYAIYSSCGGTEVACNGGVTSGTTYTHSGLTGGNTYWVRVWTDDVTTGTFDIAVTQPCQPAGTRTVVADCGNNQFYLDVNVTSLGTSTDLDITTDFAGDTEPTNVGLGVTQIGPYPSGTTVVVTLVHDNGGACNLALSSVSFTCPPANDLCENAIAISCNSVINASTVNSTTTGAPASTCGGFSMNTAGGIWYTLPGWDGPITIDLSGSSYDTKLAVYTGTCGALVCVDGDDDDGAGATSLVTFAGSSAETYYVYVTGFSTNTGNVVMTVTCGSNNPICPENGLTLEIEADANFAQTSWEIVTLGSNVVAATGGGLPAPAIITQFACLPDGCYRLRVLDAGNDGITNGGYILRTQGDNQRIIDNRDNFTTGSESAVIGNGGFCLPLGTDKLIFTSCDKLDWVNNQFIVAAPNPAVSAQFGVNNANSGYQFWWFDPNGTYGYTKFRSHATSDGFGTGATRACHARINNWSPNQIPANVLMNVKVRGRVNGTNLPWGPVCRFKIDPVRASCPLTKLMDIPGNVNYSCGVTRAWGGSAASKVVAKPVDGATQYQFRFDNAELASPVVRTTTTPVLQLNWSPALDNGTYDVEVRAFKNGQWCILTDPWGDVCTVTITGSPNAMVLDGGPTTSTGDVKLALFPNPNNGQQLTVSLSSVAAGVETIAVDIFDLNGARVSAQVLAVNDGMVYQVVDVAGLADGLYMVNINAGVERYTERLVIAK